VISGLESKGMDRVHARIQRVTYELLFCYRVYMLLWVSYLICQLLHVFTNGVRVIKDRIELGMHVYNPNTWEAEVGKSQVQGLPGLYR
jgi:hypothetical protein